MAEYPPTLDFNILKKEMNLSDKVIKASRFSENELQAIYTDYLNRLPDLEKLKNDFISQYIVPAKNLSLHSYNGRVKDPYHLIEKIIRKRSTNDNKYSKMSVVDYYKYITDLIGCRILLVYKKNWEEVHDYLTNSFSNDPNAYINEDDYVSSYDKVQSPFSPYMAERPIAHIRLGDPEIYHNKLKVCHNHYYRSLHYIIRDGQYYIEIQVRTLFDEAWGEVDHDVLYPYHKNDAILVNFSQLLNRVAGAGDEMSAYFKDVLLPERPTRNTPPLDVPMISSRDINVLSLLNNTATTPLTSSPNGSSSKEILNSILYGNPGM